MWWSHTSESKMSESFSSVIMWGCFLFQHGPLWAPKYHLAESTTTMLANCSRKGRMELCVMKSHIRKECLRKLPSSYYVRTFPYSPWARRGSQISLCRLHEKSVSKLTTEEKRVTLWVAFTHGNAVSQKASLQFSSEDISFFTMGPYGLPNITLQNTLQQC